MREIKNLIVTNSIAMFVLSEEYARGIPGIEDTSNNTLFHQKFLLESGKMIDAVSNTPGELRTYFGHPEEIKYGHKDSQYLIHPICSKDEEIQIVIQCESK